MYYTGVDDLPIKTLFKIFETGDLSHLVIEAKNKEKGDRKVLNKLWEEIKSDYKLLDPSSNFDLVLEVSQRIDYLKARHEMISLAIYVLRFEPDEDMIKVLEDAKYKVDRENLHSSLDAIEYEAKAITTKIGVKESELKKLTEKGDYKNSDINEILAIISANLSVTFRFNEVTVVEFFAFKKELERKSKANKEAQAKSKHGRRR